MFNKVTVLYSGRQIFFGKVDNTISKILDLIIVLIDLCFKLLVIILIIRPTRQTTPDFLISTTSP